MRGVCGPWSSQLADAICSGSSLTHILCGEFLILKKIRRITLITSSFGRYLVFADETGDHGLSAIDEQFPVFALVFCLIRKEDYIQQIVPAVQRLKIAVWGHDQVIFHEREIRKETGVFSVLRSSKVLRNWFLQELTRLIAEAPMKIAVTVIEKRRLIEGYGRLFNPYEIAMRSCMQEALEYLVNQGQLAKTVPVIFESRGRGEDAALETEFRRVCNDHSDFQRMNFEYVFAHKRSNSVGLQLADLVARPLALRHLRPDQPNRATQAVEDKLIRFKVLP